ncbi:hypothetical protein D3C84_809220 [compost metagenome]
MGLLQSGQTVHEPAGGKGRVDPNTQWFVSHLCGQASCGSNDALECRLNAFEILLAEFRQANARAITIEELHIQVALQQADLPADRRLTDMKFFGRLGKALQARNGLENTQRIQGWDVAHHILAFARFIAASLRQRAALCFPASRNHVP